MNIFFQNGDKVLTLKEVVETIDGKIAEDGKKRFAILWENGPYEVLSAQPGKKYIKLVKTNRNGQRSVYCFLDMDGNIYKSATWHAPAKHIRGSIWDKDMGWGKALGPYGAAYLK